MAKIKEQKPKILKVTRADAHVIIKTQLAKSSEQQAANDPDKPGEKKVKLVTSSSDFTEKAHEAPLPSFDEALQALGKVAASVLGVDPSWASKGDKGKLEVTELSISYTDNGTRSATIGFTKSLLDGTVAHKLTTPMFRIDDDKSGKGRRECTPKHAELVVDMIKEAQRYSQGERSQELLKFTDDTDDEDTEPSKIEHLPGMEQE